MIDQPRPRQTATLIGFAAVLLWSSLALLTRAVGAMPPFQITALSFLIGGVSLFILRPRASLRALRQPLPTLALGVGGLFFYHACYFFALSAAPPVEAGLLNYLWPLLIVLFSALLPGERLSRHAALGGLIAFSGAALVIIDGGGLSGSVAQWPGYLAALAAAVIWAVYSVLWRLLPRVPSEAMAGFCLITAFLAFALHSVTEPTVWPQGALQWGMLGLLGLGPVGLAFYFWDIGVKRGNLPLLGVVSYAAPILSTSLLILAGEGRFTPAIGLAAVLMTLGALLASRQPKPGPEPLRSGA